MGGSDKSSGQHSSGRSDARAPSAGGAASGGTGALPAGGAGAAVPGGGSPGAGGGGRGGAGASGSTGSGASSNGGTSGSPGTGGAGGGLPTAAFVYVGSGDFGSGNGSVTLYRFEYGSQTLSQVARVPVGGLASFLAVDAPRSALFEADEADGNLRLLPLDAASHAPLRSTLSTAMTAGHPVHVTVTRDGHFALVAHYNEGKAESFGVQGGAITGSVDVESPGAQAHEIVLSPDERYAFVPCRGSDRVARLAFDSSSGALAALAPFPTRAGDGPRHIAFHPNGKFAYVITELSSTVIACTYAAADGSLAELMRTTSLPPSFSGTSAGAEIVLDRTGNFLYASNRISGSDGDIAAFRVGSDGRLTSIGHRSTLGHTPRSFAMDATSRFLFVGNQDSNTVAVMTIDPGTGALGAAKTTDVGLTPYFVGAAPFTE